MSAPLLGLLPEGQVAPPPMQALQLHLGPSPPSCQVPGEQNGRVVVQRVGIPFMLMLFLPLAEAPQSVVCMVRDSGPPAGREHSH